MCHTFTQVHLTTNSLEQAWQNVRATLFWKTHGFEWRPKTATWQRDTRRPLRGKRYTPAA